MVRPCETDFRILCGEEIRWISARGQGDDAGIVGFVMFGTFLDVTGRKQAEEAYEPLAGEMSHRGENLLAVASGLTTITSRATTTAAEIAHELTARLAAPGSCARPHPAQHEQGRPGGAGGRPHLGPARTL